ncbi:hypothetical protein Avbf_03173 [Armadillidium vulgare]|nr:hypothetical protein Avbf_03173 [Armadillidium vulgare]
MELRKKLMEIENSIVAMSIEYEKQNQVIQEYENEKESKKKGRRASEDASDPDDGKLFYPSADEIDEDDPEEILEAWEDLVYIHNEQNRYAEMKQAINEELKEKKERCKEIEEKGNLQSDNYSLCW